MSQKQLKTYKVISSFIEKAITRERAAELLGLSTRQVTRLKKGVEASGVDALIHKNTGRKPAHAIRSEVKEKILEIHSREEYREANFLHFKEMLLEDHGISISYTSLSSILKNAGVKSPLKKKRKRRASRRRRKPHPGQLLQIDASPYEWFGGSVKYALHGAIDDATGSIVGLYMARNECLFGYLETMRQCCLDFGVPQSIYSDRHTIFLSPKADRLSVEETVNGRAARLTQFGRAMHELGADMVYAHSPQAKGRVERLWGTLQGRLPVEFKKRGIKTLAAANAFLEEYRFLFNGAFSVEPEGAPLYVPLRKDVDIDSILCVKHARKTDNAGTFSFKNRCFQILDEGFPVISARKEIQVLITPRAGIRVEYKGRVYKTVRYIKPARKDAKRTVTRKTIHAVTPHLRHGSDEWKKIWWGEDYNLSLQFLYELFFEKQQSSA